MEVQLDLFADSNQGVIQRDTQGVIQRDLQGVKGLCYCAEFLSKSEQEQTLAEIKARPWLNDLKREVQHYGYKYDYKARTVDPTMYLGPLPDFAEVVAKKMLGFGLIDEMPDQLIVNKYEPGQGISAHVDCEPCFKNVIATVSLGSEYEMDFIPIVSGTAVRLRLGLGSALVFRDEARYQWMHRIKSRLNEKWGPRRTRVSLTFRNVNLAGS